MGEKLLHLRKVVGPFQCNCHLIACPKTGDAALVDPGDDASRLLEWVKTARLPDGRPVQLKWLLHTHGHLDHVGATRPMKEAHADAVIALHAGDEPLYRALPMQGQLFGMKYPDPLPVEKFLEHEEEVRVGELKFSVVHTPGHSPGSVCLRMHEDSSLGTSETLFSGDTLFQSSVGRTDLWGADSNQMFSSIRNRILTLDGDTRVCPGHGPDTRVGIEKKSNPFLK
jgi:glyoxylase-like metal-dependent hydrolase (beta-lactamase superfamily II)